MDEEELIEVGDDTPKLEEQARLHGWKAGIFDFGKAAVEGVEHFNPALVRRDDGLWLIVRRSELVPGMPYGRNGLWACKLGEDLKPEGGPLLTFPDSTSQEQFEDPRAFRWGGQTWIGAVNFIWYPDGSWTGAHQCLFSYRDDAEWTPIVRRDPPVETNLGQAGHTNGRHNKNFLWFIHEGQLHLIYTSDPWKVIAFGGTWEEQKPYVAEGVKWKYGQVRGGTTPVQVGDLFYTFFHSSLPWRGRFRRYYMGALAFEAKPPFTPVLWTQEPLLIGSQNSRWFQQKPLVIFPCGALYENDEWLVSYGSNDLDCGWLRLPHEDLVKLLQPLPPAPASMLLAQATERPEVILSGGGEIAHEGSIPVTGSVPAVSSPEPGSPRPGLPANVSNPPSAQSTLEEISEAGNPVWTAMHVREQQAHQILDEVKKKEAMLERMANARAVRAENRAKGLLAPPKKPKRRKRRKATATV